MQQHATNAETTTHPSFTNSYILAIMWHVWVCFMLLNCICACLGICRHQFCGLWWIPAVSGRGTLEMHQKAKIPAFRLIMMSDPPTMCPPMSHSHMPVQKYSVCFPHAGRPSVSASSGENSSQAQVVPTVSHCHYLAERPCEEAGHACAGDTSQAQHGMAEHV